MLTSCSACGYGKGSKSVASTTVKIAVVAPIPSAIVVTAVKVNPGDFQSWRRANLRSFMSFGAQCLNWINVRRTPGREQTCDQRNCREQNGRTSKQRRIVCRNFVQLRGNQASEREGSHDPDHESYHNRSHSLVQDEPQHIARLGAKRHSHADLAGALLYRVCDCAIDPDCCEHQSNARKNSEQPGHQPRLAKGLCYDFLHRLWQRDCKTRINGCQR